MLTTSPGISVLSSSYVVVWFFMTEQYDVTYIPTSCSNRIFPSMTSIARKVFVRMKISLAPNVTETRVLRILLKRQKEVGWGGCVQSCFFFFKILLSSSPFSLEVAPFSRCECAIYHWNRVRVRVVGNRNRWGQYRNRLHLCRTLVWHRVAEPRWDSVGNLRLPYRARWSAYRLEAMRASVGKHRWWRPDESPGSYRICHHRVESQTGICPSWLGSLKLRGLSDSDQATSSCQGVVTSMCSQRCDRQGRLRRSLFGRT